MRIAPVQLDFQVRYWGIPFLAAIAIGACVFALPIMVLSEPSTFKPGVVSAAAVAGAVGALLGFLLGLGTGARLPNSRKG